MIRLNSHPASLQHLPDLAGFARGAVLPENDNDTVAELPAGWSTAMAVSLHDPAMHVVTDFQLEQPVTVAAERFIDEAELDMIAAGVGSLLVVKDDAVVGLITAQDIQGERPTQFLQDAGYLRHPGVRVRHVMTPWEDAQTLDVRRVREAQVGAVVDFFSTTRATHALVVEYPEHGDVIVRGLLSRSRVQRLLGRPIPVPGRRGTMTARKPDTHQEDLP